MQSINIIGGALVDLNFGLPKQYFHRYQQAAKIELPFGEKLITDGYTITPGGSGANVAVGLVKAGFRTWFHTGIASDVFGSFLKKELKRHGVELDEGDGGDQTPISVILRIGGERTIITGRSRPSSFPSSLPESGWLHLGPLHGDLEVQLSKVLSHQIKTSQELSMNPSIDMIESRSRSFLSLLKVTSILFVNRIEGLALTRLPHRSLPKEILVGLRRFGPKVVCLTDGENGAYLNLEGQFRHALALTAQFERIDATGAGDAFTTGFLAGYLSSREELSEERAVETALGYAIANSGAAVTEVGGQTGLLAITDMAIDAKRVRLKEIS